MNNIFVKKVLLIFSLNNKELS